MVDNKVMKLLSLIELPSDFWQKRMILCAGWKMRCYGSSTWHTDYIPMVGLPQLHALSSTEK